MSGFTADCIIRNMWEEGAWGNSRDACPLHACTFPSSAIAPHCASQACVRRIVGTVAHTHVCGDSAAAQPIRTRAVAPPHAERHIVVFGATCPGVRADDGDAILHTMCVGVGHAARVGDASLKRSGWGVVRCPRIARTIRVVARARRHTRHRVRHHTPTEPRRSIDEGLHRYTWVYRTPSCHSDRRNQLVRAERALPTNNNAEPDDQEHNNHRDWRNLNTRVHAAAPPKRARRLPREATPPRTEPTNAIAERGHGA